MQALIRKGFTDIFNRRSIVSISGASGTGKTSLALYLMGEILSDENTGSCFWIQASENFPKNRLKSMYASQENRLNFLLKNIYIAPKSVFSSYKEQFLLLKKITSDAYLFPPDLRFLVIDNISHHLRFQISQIEDIKERSFCLDEFYDSVLYPLIIKCQRKTINLVLIHEVSYNFKEHKNIPFFHKLYKRIKGVTISLHYSLITKERTMEISISNKSFTIPFEIVNTGFVFL